MPVVLIARELNLHVLCGSVLGSILELASVGIESERASDYIAATEKPYFVSNQTNSEFPQMSSDEAYSLTHTLGRTVRGYRYVTLKI